MKEYYAIENKKSKYCKNVPYITKKEFKKIDNPIIIGKTRLKKYDSNSDEKVDLLYFENEQYEVKEKIFGFKKGYIDVGDNNYILLKSRIPFLFLLFFLILLLLLLFLCKPENKRVEDPSIIEPPVQEEIKVPENSSNEETTIFEDEPIKQESNNNNQEEKEDKKLYNEVVFEANGGNGTMNSITCERNSNCKLPKVTFNKVGYTFKGWSKNPLGKINYKNEENIKISENGKVVLYAIWNVNTYNIKFIDYDGTLIKEDKYDYGTEIIEPEEPQRTGFIFAGWDNEISTVKESMIYKATYNITNYNIVYNLDNGILNDAPLNYNIESNINVPNPFKKGYTFIGWSSKTDDEKIIDYEIPKGTTGDIELTANYRVNKYNLIYNTNGAKEKLAPKEVEYNSEFGDLPIITKEGYNFVNWTNNANKEVSSKTIFNEVNDINIFANWETISYEIKYNLVGGNIENNPTSYNIESDNIVIPNPTKEGYIFLGWSSKDDNVFIKDYEISKGTTGDIELTANYKPITYYVSYNSQGAEGTMENTKVKYNNKLLLSKNSFEKEGYIFKGWSLVPEGEVVYNDEAEIYNLSSEDGAIINLYAKWEVIKLGVKYLDLFGAVLKEEVVDYGSNPNFPANPFIDGYTFIGWDSDATNVITSDTVYKAKYIINYYDIVYDLNTGQENDKNTIRYNVETDTITLPNPTRTGYTFLGWTGSNGLTPQKNISIVKRTLGNKNYIANWEANSYIITLNPNKGVVTPTTVSTSYNSLYGILPIPERIGYSFEGWYIEEEKILESTVMDKTYNHELLAKWEVINYDISYDLKGGTLSSPINQYNIETETFTLKTPTKEGYTFLGWTGSNGSIPQKNVTLEKGSYGNKNYIANWEVINYSINYNLDGGSADSLITQYNIETPSFSLPIPNKTGYTFTGWTGTGLSSTSKNVTISNETGNRSYTAVWSKNYYTVKYYKDGTLWETRSVGYGDDIPNLTPTGYDDYHKFGGWSGWTDKMPSNDITLTAITSESYCMLLTGTASKANAEGLQVIFMNVGYKSWLYENSQGWGAYTDYSLSRFQVDGLRETFGNSVPWANATPYLNWLSIQCDNGHGEVWKRYSNGNTWTILESW